MNASDDSKNSSDIQRVFQSRGQTKAYYNKISKVYDLLADHSEAPVRNAGLKMLSPAQGENILEIGFGTGHCLVDLAKAVGQEGKVYGIDLSEEMIKLSGKLLKKEGLDERAELRCGDATELPFGDGSMDAIFMSFTLELFDTPEIPQVLSECKRVLQPDGRILVVGMSKEGKEGFMLKAYEWTHHHFPNFVDCRPIYVQQALEKAGFTIKDTAMMHIWLPVEIVLGVKE